MKAKELLETLSQMSVNLAPTGIIHDVGYRDEFASKADQIHYYFKTDLTHDIPNGDYFWIYDCDDFSEPERKWLRDNSSAILDDNGYNIYLILLED